MFQNNGHKFHRPWSLACISITELEKKSEGDCLGYMPSELDVLRNIVHVNLVL